MTSDLNPESFKLQTSLHPEAVTTTNLNPDYEKLDHSTRIRNSVNSERPQTPVCIGFIGLSFTGVGDFGFIGFGLHPKPKARPGCMLGSPCCVPSSGQGFRSRLRRYVKRKLL